MIIGEAHLLHLTACVFFARCRIWVAKWDKSVTQPPLLFSGVHVHIVDVKGILHKALVCRGPIKHKDRNASWVYVLENINCMFELLDQLGEIPPHIKALSGVGIFSGFKHG